MTLNNIIRRKIVSFLQPWLREEPNLDVKLGFIESYAISRNLRFNCSVLNQLLDEPPNLFFKEVTAEQITIRFSSWSAPAFTVEVHGVSMKLSLENLDEDASLKQFRKPKDDFSEILEKKLSALDPEGAALHYFLGRILETIPPKHDVRTSILNLIFKQCHLDMHGIEIRVQCQATNDLYVCFGEIKDFSARSKDLSQGCLLKGLLSALFLPSKENSYVLNCIGCTIGVNVKDCTDRALLTFDLLTQIKTLNLKLLNLSLRVPELSFSVSPDDLVIFVALQKLLSYSSKRCRNGRQLWRQAAKKLIHASLFRKLANGISQWLLYVKAYESLLTLIGYSVDHLLKRFIGEVTRKESICSFAKHQWETISEIEKDLPAEGIALARRVARSRAAVNVHNANGDERHSFGILFRRSSHFLSLLANLWKLLLQILFSIAKIFLLRKVDSKPGRTLYEGTFQSFSFAINLGKVKMDVHQLCEIPYSFNELLQSQIGITYSDFHSFSLLADGLSLLYEENIIKYQLVLSCGEIKVKSSCFTKSPAPLISPADFASSMGENHKRKIEERSLDSLLWVDPAKWCCCSDSNSSQVGCSFGPLSGNILGDMWLNWKRVHNLFDNGEIEYSQDPCIHCEIAYSVMDADSVDSGSGYWKCTLNLGKINIVLSHTSILSVFVLCGSIKHALWGTKEECGTRFPPCAGENAENLHGSLYIHRSKELIFPLIRRLPEKYIQLGILFGGICVQFSLEKGFNDGQNGADNSISQENSCFTLDLHSIKAVVCPTSSFDMASLTACLGFDDVELDAIRMEPQVIEIPKCNNEMYVSRRRILLSSYLCLYGMHAYMGNATDEHQLELLALMPTLISISSLREYIFSLSTRTVAFSASLGISFSGFTAYSYIDELYIIFQVIGRLSSAISFLFSSFESCSFTMADSLGLAMLIKEPHKEPPIVVLSISGVLFSINGIFRLKSIDLVFHKSRASDNEAISMGSPGFLNFSKLAEKTLPSYGILLSLRQTTLELSFEEGKITSLTDLSGLELRLFEYQNQEGKMYYIENLLSRDVHCLYEIALSSCIFSVYLGDPLDTLGSGSVNKSLHSGSDDSTTSLPETSLSTLKSKWSNVNSGCPGSLRQKTGFSSIVFVQSLGHWLLVNVSMGSIFIGQCTTKKVLVGAHHSNKLQSQISVGGDLEVIFWEIEGGVIIMDAIALAMCFRSLVSYFDCVSHLICMHFYEKHPWTRADDSNRPEVTDDTQQTNHSCQQPKKQFPDVLSLDLSSLSLSLVLEIESGGIQEFVFEVDVNVNLKLENLGRQCIFDISRLAIVSQIVDGCVGDESAIPHFSSATLEASSSSISPGYSSSRAYCLDETSLAPDASCSSKSVAFKKLDRIRPEASHLSYQSQLLKHLRVHLALEESAEHGPLLPEIAFFGTGSVTGFDMVISLSELEMILSVLSSISAVFDKETTIDLQQIHLSTGQGFDNSVEALIPNGAIVAIQDVDQHMYFTVEGGESNYSVGGALHYSLVGEKALFRVKYHYERRWKSTVLWFSLISLHARNKMGEHLRLNCRQGSGFVEISSSNDGVSALWKALPCEQDDSMDDTDLEPYNQLINKTFHLTNKKNDLYVAFLDGVAEFMRKPGHPFKFKVFHDLPLTRDLVHNDGNRVLASRSSQELIEERGIGQDGKLPQIEIIIEKISVTIVHKLPDTKDSFPLLRGCIGNTQLILQNLPIKSRVIVTTSAALDYFDARICIWRELLCPVDLYFFYRKNHPKQSADISSHGVLVNIYCRTGALYTYITELSLDILLYIVGKLDVSGPYAVRNLMIMSNSCKVNNQSGLNLICDFHDKQRIVLAKRQSTSILLRRHLDVENPDSEVKPSVSLQLSDLGFLATSSINLLLLDARISAWRTRIITIEDSKTRPGPFLVIEISRRNEDGLSVVVSPLMRIHNATGHHLELRFQRPEAKEDEFACLFLKPGECIDDTMTTFDATTLSGGVKKALMSLGVGNFLFSFRPDLTEDLHDSKTSLSAEWSDFLSGGKAVRLSGLFDKLSYRVRMALTAEPVRCSFSTTFCTLKDKDTFASDMHFLIQTISRDVPIIPPETLKDNSHYESSPVALHEQKEIFLLPTVRVTNLMHSEISVFLSETGQSLSITCNSFGKQAKLSPGSSADFFANPATIYFKFTIIAPNLTSKPVNSSDWVKMLQKKKTSSVHLDINLDFGGGNYIATLRLYRGDKGVLEAAIFTPYTLSNGTEFPIYIITTNKKHISRTELEKWKFEIPSDLGMFLPPNSTISWLLKFKKVQLKSLEGHTSETLLDLDAFSGLTEMSLIKKDESGIKSIMKLGLSAEFSSGKPLFPSQTVTLVPRYVLHNTSEENIFVRQYYAQDAFSSMVAVQSKQQITLHLREGLSKSREYSLFENFIRKHRSSNDDSSLYVHFGISESELGWSGPVCIASLGRFFLKFRKQPNQATFTDHNSAEFASVHVVEKGSTLTLHFYKPPDVSPPYRVENCLPDLSITFYQKDSSEVEVLGPSCNVNFIWDDYTLPHKLVVQINDSLLLREIKLDKVQSWKHFYKPRQHGVLGHYLLMQKKPEDLKNSFDGLHGVEVSKIGYEIYADGPTRVLRISEISDKFKRDSVFNSSGKIRFRITQFAAHLLEPAKDEGKNMTYNYTPIMAAKFENLNLDMVFSDQKKYAWIVIQSLNFELKWVGAPFASMLRLHQLDYNTSNDYMLKVVFSMLSSSSDVKQVKYWSMFIQPMDLNLDEETLMKIVPFWRKSLSSSESHRYYFDHFEIHPLKIIANFVPGEQDSSYTSAQEALRSLLHSVVKVPAIKNMVVELNGILITHALVTLRELSFKCGQHYSWYAMRAIYVAKGSPLLPPDFVSIFDDLSSSSLDVFFDPSRVLISLPGFTLGTFKFIRKCISGKGFSGRKRYFGDLGNTLRTAGSNVLYTAVTEISDSVLKGAERSGFNGLLSGFHQGVLKLALEPSLLGTALMEGGPDRKIQLDRSPGIDELYIEGYLQAMLDTFYRQEYLRVRVIDNQVILKNLPPNNSLIDEIMNRVKGFLASKGLLKGDSSTYSHSLRHLRGESEWKLGPTVLTLCEHLFVSFAIRTMRKHANRSISRIKWKEGWKSNNQEMERAKSSEENKKIKFIWRWGIGKFVFSGILAYIDGRLCRCIPNPIARRIVSGFVLSFLDKNDDS